MERKFIFLKFLIIFLIQFVVVSAMASSLEDFTGQFKITKCNVLAWEKGSLVKVSVVEEQNDKLQRLRIYNYFQDGGGTGEYFILGSEVLRNPDFGRSNPIKLVKTEGVIKGNILINKVTHILADDSEVLIFQMELRKTSTGLKYLEINEHNRYSCTLEASK